MDKDLLSLVQTDVKGIIAELNEVKTKLEKDEEARREEIDKILERLVSMEKMLTEELLRRVEGMEQGLAETNIKVEEVEQGLAETNIKVEEVEQGLAETNIKVEVRGKRVDEGMAQLQDSLAKTDGKVEQLAHEFKSQRMEDVKPG